MPTFARRLGAATAMAAISLLVIPAARADVKVVTSIKPIQSLAAIVMEGVGEPSVLVDGAASPHAYSLRPSQARDLEQADVVFWVGPDLEAFLERPLEALASNARTIELMEVSGLVKVPYREQSTEELDDHGDDHGDEEHAKDEHGHDDHDHDHDKHAKDEHGHDDHDHDHDKHAKDDHGHDDHGHGHGHDHGGDDPHVWLDPVNGQAMLAAMAEVLAQQDPAHADRYRSNAEKASASIDALKGEIAGQLAPLSNKRYVVFHDAYQYFERRFGLAEPLSVTVSPEVAPGAERLVALRKAIGSVNAVCVFAEPQFEPKVVNVVAEGTGVKSGVLDPLGSTIDSGPGMYPQLLRNMASALQDCLS